MTFLNLTQQLVPFARNDVEIIVGQLAPLFFNLAFKLFPVTFSSICIHGYLPKKYRHTHCDVTTLVSAYIIEIQTAPHDVVGNSLRR